MKYITSLLFCLLPIAANASVLLGNCDKEPRDVIIRNSGSERTVTITQNGGEIEEYGPISAMSFQIKDKDPKKKHPAIMPLSPFEEFCIWSNEIKVQRMNTMNASGGSL